MRLAHVVKAKKEWAEKEKQKGADLIKELEDRKKQVIKNIDLEQEKIRTQMTKLEGCLLVLNELEEEAEALIKEEEQTDE